VRKKKSEGEACRKKGRRKISPKKRDVEKEGRFVAPLEKGGLERRKEKNERKEKEESGLLFK